jgi:hypothetical protein
MPDLKMTVADAEKTLQQKAESAKADLTYHAERLAESLRAVAEVRASPVPTFDTAAAAAVIDFQIMHEHRSPQLQINVGGSTFASTDLQSSLPRGRYRVLLLFTKLPDET